MIRIIETNDSCVQIPATQETSMANTVEYSHFTVTDSVFTYNNYSDTMIRADCSFAYFDNLEINNNNGRFIRATQTDSVFIQNNMISHTGDTIPDIVSGGEVTDVCNLCLNYLTNTWIDECTFRNNSGILVSNDANST